MIELKAKYEFYAEHAEPDLQDCDSLLFTSLTEAARESSFDITRFRDKRGAWHRNVDHDCYVMGNSGSTISRDMLLGLYWYTWIKRRRDIAKQLLAYAWEHNFIMGKGEISRTYMTMNMLNTLAHLNQALGNKLSWPERILLYLPTSFPRFAEGYEAHLAVLHMLLREEMGLHGYQEAFDIYRQEHPANALFLYAAGMPHAAKEMLMDSRLFPRYRLPTEKDRRGGWLWQRDWGDSWLPGSGEKRHSGGDFLFVSYLILRDKAYL